MSTNYRKVKIYYILSPKNENFFKLQNKNLTNLINKKLIKTNNLNKFILYYLNFSFISYNNFKQRNLVYTTKPSKNITKPKVLTKEIYFYIV